MLPSFTSLIKTLRHFPKALTVTIFSTALFTDRGIGKGISDTGKVSRRMIFTLLNLLSDEKLKSILSSGCSRCWLPFPLNFAISTVFLRIKVKTVRYKLLIRLLWSRRIIAFKLHFCSHKYVLKRFSLFCKRGSEVL